MRLIIQKSIWIAIPIVALVGIFLQIPPFFLLRDQMLLAKLQARLEQSLKESGLNISIQKVHWAQWNKLIANDIRLSADDGTDVPLVFKKLTIKMDLFSLLQNRRNPEASLRELELVGFGLQIERFKDGSWNLGRYFTVSGRRLNLRTVVRIKDGTIRFRDARYGSYQIQKVNGIIDLRGYPTAFWNLRGKILLHRDLILESNGQMNTERKIGLGKIRFKGLPLGQVGPWLADYLPCRVQSGLAAGSADFAWSHKGVWLNNGQAEMTGASLSVPGFPEPFRVHKLSATFSPKRIRIIHGRILYKKSPVKVYGSIDAESTAIQAGIDGNHFPMEDLAAAFPKLAWGRIHGLVDVKLRISGTVSKPLLNGGIKINKAGMTVAGRKIDHISGKLKLLNNHLVVERLEGNYLRARIGISGQVRNLLNPEYDLKIYGSNLDLSEWERKFPGLNLKLSTTTEFTGRITGDWRRPLISGEMTMARIGYDRYQLDDLSLQFAWDFKDEVLQILKLESNLYEGHLSARGNIRIHPQTAVWDLTGRFSQVNAAKIPYGAENGIAGRVSTDLIVRGHWKKGENLEIGPVFGSLTGENLYYKTVALDKAQAVFSWQDRKFQVESLQLNVGQGRVFGGLTWEHSNLSVNLNVRDVRLKHLLSKESNCPVDGVFRGNVKLEGPVARLEGKINGEFKEAAWQSKRIGDVSGEIHYKHGVIEIPGVDWRSRAGNLAVKGKLGLGDHSNLDLTLTGEAMKLTEFISYFPAGNKIDLHGYGRVEVKVNGPLSGPVYQGIIDLDHPGYQNLVMEQGHIEFSGNLREIQINACRLSNKGSVLELSGLITGDTIDLTYSGHLTDVAMLGLAYQGNVIKGQVDLNGKMSGPPGAPVITMALTGERLSFGTFVNHHLTAELNLKYPLLEIESAQLGDGSSRYDVAGNLNFSGPGQLNLDLKVSDVEMEKLPTFFKIQGIDVDGKLSGWVRVEGTFNDPTIKVNADVNQGFINGFPVTGELELNYSHHDMYIQRVELKHDDGTLFINGIWEDGKVLKLRAFMMNFPLLTIASFTKPQFKLEGITNADFQLEWSQSGITGAYQCEIANLTVNQNRLGNLALAGNYSEHGISIASGSLASAGGYLRVKGYLPWPIQMINQFHLPARQKLLHNIDLDLTAENLQTEIANFMPRTLLLSKGRFNGNLRLRGTFDNPVLSGKLECDNAQMDLAQLPLTVNDFQMSLNINSNRVEIINMSGNIQKGKVAAGGYIDLEKLTPKRLAVAISGSKIYYKNQFFDGYADANIKITGKLEKPVLSGDISVYNCKIGIPAGNRAQVQSRWEPQFDVTIKTGKNVRYRQIGIADVTVTGELQVKGDVNVPRLNGKVTSSKGVLTLYGQNFIVQRGLALFSPERQAKPYIEVESTLATRKAQIILIVKGQVGTDLLISLSSQPYLPQSEIFALLNWSEFNGDKPLTIDGMIDGNLSFVTDSLLGDVFNEIRNTLHIDYFYLDTDYSQNKFRINMGDYVTDELFVSYARSVNPDEPEETWGFDYHLTSRLSVGGTYSLEDGTTWRLMYGFGF